MTGRAVLVPAAVLLAAAAVVTSRRAGRGRVRAVHPSPAGGGARWWATPALAVAVPSSVHRLLRRAGAGRRARRIERALPPWLDQVNGRLRAGDAVVAALLGPVGPSRGPLAAELAAVRTDVELGAPVDEALKAWRARCPITAVELVVAAAGMVLEGGGTAVGALDAVAATLRSRAAVAAEAHALATQGRASAVVVVAAPVAFAAFLATVDPDTLGFLTATAAGRSCLLAGLALDAVGAGWMHVLTRRPA